jgi:3-hydroxyanthranilate 3,4-dioxygenase
VNDLHPIHFPDWLRDNRAALKPPVGNRQLWPDREFMVTVVAGPNSRTDFHIDEGEEFFYQLEGDITLRVMEQGVLREVPIRQGDMFLLPPRVPHSPKRPAGTLGLVIERRRLPSELDGFVWFCPKCGNKLYEEFLHVTDLVGQLPPIFDRFYGDPAHCTCAKCGTRVTKL